MKRSLRHRLQYEWQHPLTITRARVEVAAGWPKSTRHIEHALPSSTARRCASDERPPVTAASVTRRVGTSEPAVSPSALQV